MNNSKIIKVLKETIKKWKYEYEILDACLELHKAKFTELLQENAELKAYKDVNEDFKKAWDELKAENDRLNKILQEIKEIAEICISKDGCFECKYSDDCHIEDAEFPTYDICKLLIQKITKAEEE